MKDLSEAELIEMERRAVGLLNDLEFDPSEMGRSELEDTWEIARARLFQLGQDIEVLCEHARTKRNAAA